MEEAVVHDLVDEIVGKFAADLVKVITTGNQFGFVIDRNARDVFHDKRAAGGMFSVKLWNVDVFILRVVRGKFLHVGGFLEEVHFILRDSPELVYDCVEIHEIPELADRREPADNTLEEPYVACHRIINAFTLHLDDDFFTGQQAGFMHLGDRSGPERNFIDRLKDFTPVRTIGMIQDFLDLGEGHGRYFGIQFHELVAVSLRKNIRVQGHDLAKLNVCGSELFDNYAQLFG